MSSRYSRAHELLVQQGANEEYVRLEPRNKLLKLAVAERDETIASLTKEVRALRLEVRRLKADLQAQVLKDASKLNELCQKVNHATEQVESWMHWAWIGQPASKGNADGAVYEAKIAALETAVEYWSCRALEARPANSQAVADQDTAIDFSCRHLRLEDILRLMGSMGSMGSMDSM